MNTERKKTPPPVDPPDAGLSWLHGSPCAPPGRLSGRSLKFIRSLIPVLVFEASETELKAYEETLKSGEQGATRDPLVEKIIAHPGQLKLIVNLPETARETHILIQTRADETTGDARNRPFLSIDRLYYDLVTREWKGEPADLQDLERKTIRLAEDREPQVDDCVQVAVLASMLDFAPDAGLLAACKERFQEEEARKLSRRFLKKQFKKLVTGALPSRGFKTLDSMNALKWFLPELAAGKGLEQNRYHKYDIYHHSMYACDAVHGPDLVIRLAALFHDLGKVDTRREKGNGEATFHNHEMVSARHTENILRRLDFEPWVAKRVRFLVRSHMFHYTDEWTDKAVRRFMRKVRPDVLQDLITLRLADREGSGKRTELPRAIKNMIKHIEEVRASEAEFKVRDLAIGGQELLSMGMQPGPAMGELLQVLLNQVKGEEIANEVEALQTAAREWMAADDSREANREAREANKDTQSNEDAKAQLREVVSSHEQ